MKPWSVLLFFSLFLASCASLISQVLSPPQIVNQSLQIESVDLEQIQLGLRFSIENPNSIDLPIDKLDAQVSIQEQVVFENQYVNLGVLKAKDRTQIPLKVFLKWKDIWILGKAVLNKEKLNYQLKGEAIVRGWKISLDHKGTIDEAPAQPL